MNIEKLDEAIAYIEAHPEEHDQAFYFARYECGTTACLAGTAAVQAGWKPVWLPCDDDCDHGWPGTSFVQRGAETREAFDVASEVLGLTTKQAIDLFVFSGSLADIKRIRDEIAAESP